MPFDKARLYSPSTLTTHVPSLQALVEEHRFVVPMPRPGTRIAWRNRHFDSANDNSTNRLIDFLVKASDLACVAEAVLATGISAQTQEQVAFYADLAEALDKATEVAAATLEYAERYPNSGIDPQDPILTFGWSQYGDRLRERTVS
jgi:hypothetical protein